MHSGPRRPIRTLCAALAVVVGAAACGVTADSSARVDADDNVPGGLLETTTTIEPPGSASASRVSVCLVASDGTLVQTTRPASAPATPATALTSVARPLEPAEVRAGLSTALSADARPTTSVAGGLAMVTLPAGFPEASASDQLAAVAQIVCTLTAQPGVGQVGFEIDGSVIEVPRGDGSTTSDPVSRQDYPATMPR
jgi:spore germination protein GerM